MVNVKTWIPATLHSVLFAPEFEVYFFSEYKVLDKGFKICSDKNIRKMGQQEQS